MTSWIGRATGKNADLRVKPRALLRVKLKVKLKAAEGKAEGERNLAELIQKLLATGRTDDTERVTRDPEYRESLYKEFGIGSMTTAADESAEN